MRYAVEDDVLQKGRFIQTAQFAVLGDALDYRARCAYGEREDGTGDVTVQVVKLETGEVLDLEDLSDDNVEMICEEDLDILAKQAA